MTTAAKSFTRRVFSAVWTFTVEPTTGVVAIERDGFEREGHRYPGFRHENHGAAGRPVAVMLREAVVMLNRLRAASSVVMYPANAVRLEGRRGSFNVNSCRYTRRHSRFWEA